MIKTIIDKSNMRQVIIDCPKQLETGLALVKNITIGSDVSNIIICAMGGSALPADLIEAVTTVHVPVYVHRSYNLHPKTNDKSLVICISYSGNTEETLSALHQAIEKKLSIVTIASGGEIEKISQEHSISFVKIPSGIQPRSATGYLFSVLASILASAKVMSDISAEIVKTSQALDKLNPLLEKSGLDLAKKLHKKVPVVYSSESLKDLARIWKIKFNENSKIPAFYNYFPELNHNEMVGYTGLKKLGAKNFFVIMLQDQAEHPRILKRMELTADVIKKSGGNVTIITLENGSLLYKIFSSLLLGDWASYQLALLQKIDPTPVVMVEEFKKSMQN